jgi:hypothetical protein
VERTTRMPSLQLLNDFPTAPLERAVLDAARRAGSVDGARAIIAEAVQRGRVLPARLRTELDRGSTRGSGLARKVLAEISDGVRSVAEAWARRLVLNSRMPKPAWNVPLCDPDGRLLAIVDAWWDDVALAWEIDSYEWHLSPQSYSDTLARDAALTAAGITVLHTTPGRIQKEPVAVLRELERAHGQARRRPRPQILAG